MAEPKPLSKPREKPREKPRQQPSEDLNVPAEHVKRRNDLAERYYPRVIVVARGLAARLPRSVTIDDLVSAGTGGLMDAANNYNRDVDPDAFWSYAAIRVQGAMLDYLRTIDYMSRRQRDGLKLMDDAQHRFRQKFGQEPTSEDLVRLTGLSADSVQELQDLLHVSMPEEGAAQHPDQRPSKAQEQREVQQLAGLEIEPRLSPEEQAQWNRESDKIAEMMKKFTPRERAIIQLYFYKGLFLKEVGAQLHLSESRVSQIVGDLRRRMLIKIGRSDLLKQLPQKIS